jgi:thioredoxin 1
MRVLKFYAEWCGPCKAMTNVINNMGDKIELPIEEIDIDTHNKVAMEYGVRSVPTMILLDENNNELKRKVGAMREQELIQFLKV